MRMQSIIERIALERQEQDRLWGIYHDDQHSNNDWIAILARQLGLAADDGACSTQARFERQMVRIAAVAIAALETLERKTSMPEKVFDQTHRGKGY